MPDVYTTLLLTQLRDCPRMDPDWHRLAWRHAAQQHDASELRARLAARLDAPDDLRATYASARTSEVRQAFLGRPDLTDAEVSAAVAAEKRAGVLSSLAAANRTSTVVLAGLGRVFTVKPTKALALALLDVEAKALPQNVADAVVTYLIGLNGRGLVNSQVALVEAWSAHLSAQQADKVVDDLKGKRYILKAYLPHLSLVRGLSEESRFVLFDATMKAAAPVLGEKRTHLTGLQENAARAAAVSIRALVCDLSPSHVLADRAAHLATSPQVNERVRDIVKFHLSRTRKNPPPFFAPPCDLTPSTPAAVATTGAVTRSDAKGVIDRLDEKRRCSLAAATVNRLLLAALDEHADNTDTDTPGAGVAVAAAVLSNPSVGDPQTQLRMLKILTSSGSGMAHPVVVDLLSRADAPDVVEAAYLCDPASAVNGYGLGKLSTRQVTNLVVALRENLSSDDPGSQVTALLGLSALAASPTLPLEAALEMPWPLICSWSEQGLHRLPGQSPEAAAPSARPLWGHVARTQRELQLNASTAAALAGLAPAFTGTLGELAATCRSISG